MQPLPTHINAQEVITARKLQQQGCHLALHPHRPFLKNTIHYSQPLFGHPLAPEPPPVHGREAEDMAVTTGVCSTIPPFLPPSLLS